MIETKEGKALSSHINHVVHIIEEDGMITLRCDNCDQNVYAFHKYWHNTDWIDLMDVGPDITEIATDAGLPYLDYIESEFFWDLLHAQEECTSFWSIGNIKDAMKIIVDREK